MTTEQKIWAALALLFFLLAMAAITSHAFWFVSTFAAPLLIDRVFAVFRGFHPLPLVNMPPYIVHFIDGTGALAINLLYGLQEYIPPVPMLLSVCAAAVGFFCVLMMIRPIETDFGNEILFGMFTLSMNLVSQEFGSFGDHGWPVKLVFCLYFLMFIIRGILEYRADVHAAAAAAAAAAGGVVVVDDDDE